MSEFDYNTQRNGQVSVNGGVASLGGQALNALQTIDCGEIGFVSGEQLARATNHYQSLSGGNCRVQLAALVFDATGDMRALDFYFPITSMLKASSEADRMEFYNAVRYIANHPNFDLRVYAEHRQDVTDAVPITVRHLVAGHVAEAFFYRKDILDTFLSHPRHFQVYTNHRAFEQDNGLAGGDYSFDREAIQLEMSRLFEGYFGKTPGVAPILHELGHMLDHFEAGTGRMGQCEGVLPGMSRRDGPVFTPEARHFFIQGKRMEQERYLAYQTGRAANGSDPIPVGHPYCFQTDGEFIAGYFEMFFRNPNYFAATNSTLYHGFASLLRQDPRRYWPEDFSGYIGENRKAYLNGQRPHPHNITVPRE